jgi:S-(hydroxymethyl)glutathione dehydrogenase / alcohol dehydrogenase
MKAAKLAGASKIISLDIHEHKRAQVGKFGADLYINAVTEDLAAALEKGAGLTRVDVIVDTSGSKRAIESTLPLLSGKGRFIFLGQPKPGETIEIKNGLHLFEGEGKMLKATQGGQFEPHREIPVYLEAYKSSALNIDGLFTHRTTLDDVNKAIDLLRSGAATRILIETQPQS